MPAFVPVEFAGRYGCAASTRSRALSRLDCRVQRRSNYGISDTTFYNLKARYRAWTNRKLLALNELAGESGKAESMHSTLARLQARCRRPSQENTNLTSGDEPIQPMQAQDGVSVRRDSRALRFPRSSRQNRYYLFVVDPILAPWFPAFAAAFFPETRI